MRFANVEMITAVKQKETPYQSGQDMIMPLKLLSPQGI